MSSGDITEPSGRRRASRSAHLAARSQVVDERRPTTDLTNRALLVSEATERRRTKLSLACWQLKARTETPVCPLSSAALSMEVATLGGMGTWAGIRGGITVEQEKGSEGDGEGTMAGSAIDSEMSVAEAETDGGGEFPSSGFIV